MRTDASRHGKRLVPDSRKRLVMISASGTYPKDDPLVHAGCGQERLSEKKKKLEKKKEKKKSESANAKRIEVARESDREKSKPAERRERAMVWPVCDCGSEKDLSLLSILDDNDHLSDPCLTLAFSAESTAEFSLAFTR